MSNMGLASQQPSPLSQGCLKPGPPTTQVPQHQYLPLAVPCVYCAQPSDTASRYDNFVHLAMAILCLWSHEPQGILVQSLGLWPPIGPPVAPTTQLTHEKYA